MNYETCMKTALQLARRGAGWTAPNPMVGAVIVKNDRVIAEGWHRRCGDLHAEHEALNNCRESCRGATLYVTLEPCCHEGRQPPCTDAILQSGIREVVIGCPDPNPQVSGNGIRILREHGITVRTGVLEQECLAPNQAFFHWIRTGLPFIALKYAMTLDGKTEAASGNSK
ncbi:bifunctional diaminohydroxyphosphoribosylaminopyrimidine deaminase/5-amino-6-(5-phosphoribosylamino)uracil reductase RibD [Faecalibaculum rodentium]|nr:bifunctional diaminohydroxyphosphoribosylaminopyrimidine deaminase/5-amino-6-(5-phosphoribosylamino)uracil reductase RibD [Faecalibaculum rodentium]